MSYNNPADYVQFIGGIINDMILFRTSENGPIDSYTVKGWIKTHINDEEFILENRAYSGDIKSKCYGIMIEGHMWLHRTGGLPAMRFRDGSYFFCEYGIRKDIEDLNTVDDIEKMKMRLMYDASESFGYTYYYTPVVFDE